MLRLLDAGPREADMPKSAEMRNMFEGASNDVPRENADSANKPSSATPTTFGQRNDLRSGADPISSGTTASGSDDDDTGTQHGVDSGRAADGKRKYDSLTRVCCYEDRGGG